MATTISVNEWLNELAKLKRGNGEEFMTTAEISALTGAGEQTIRKNLAKAVAMGVLVVGKKFVARIDGTQTTVPGYKIVKPKGGLK